MSTRESASKHRESVGDDTVSKLRNVGERTRVGSGELAHGRVRQHHVRGVDLEVQDAPQVGGLVRLQAACIGMLTVSLSAASDSHAR